MKGSQRHSKPRSLSRARAGMCSGINYLPSFCCSSALAVFQRAAAVMAAFTFLGAFTCPQVDGFAWFWHALSGSEGAETCGSCRIQESANRGLSLGVLATITFTQSKLLKRMCWLILVAGTKCNTREKIF